MDYQVWIKRDYGDDYYKVDCGDLGAVRREVDKAVRAGQEPIVTQEVPYELNIKFGEPGSEKPKRKVENEKPKETKKEALKVEVTESKAKPD